ncbi:M48 family metalloprotease [Dactylosporangium sp. CS-047395]|uniref:M48 family metalloprotease n=1 Tax=Dactylosporangium sp. CS-047395 TaxID=3239936 RepID=UPI003D8BF3D7
MDPTRFPDDTRLRVWLMLLVLGTVGLFFAYARAMPDIADAAQRCEAAAWQALPDAGENARAAARWAHEWRVCRAPAIRAGGLNLVSGLDFAMIAVGVYAAQVLWRLRRRGLRPLTGPDRDRVSSIISEYGRPVGLRRPPLVYYDLRPGARPTAFGRASRPILAVAQGTLYDLVHDRRRFDAIVHHELFHFIGNDVSVYYRALAVFRALCVQVVAFGVIFAVGIAVVLDKPARGALFAAQCAAVLGLGLAALRDYLRRREFRADMWAVDRTADRDAVERALAAGPKGRLAWLPRVFQTHPSPGERIAALHDRSRALRFTAAAALLTSVGTGLLAPTLALYLPLTGSVWLAEHANVVAGAVGGAFLGRVLAIGGWRNVHLALITGGRVPTGIATGLLAAAGLIAGGLLPLQLVFEQAGPWVPVRTVPLAAAFVGAALFCAWINAGARLRLGIHAAQLDARAYRWGVRLATMYGGIGVAALTFTAAPYRAAEAYTHRGSTNLPSPPDALLVPADRTAERFLVGLWSDWRTVTLLAIALGWLLIARVWSWQQPPPRQRAAVPPAEPATVAEPAEPTPIAEPAAAQVTSAAVTALVENAAVTRASQTPPRARLVVAWVVSGLTLAVVMLTARGTGDLPYVTVTGAAALVLAWLAYLGRPAPRLFVVGCYVACLAVGVAGTLPAHRWQDLSLIVVGVVGTIGYAHFRMPIPGERHSFTLLVGALALYNNIWILLSLVLVGALVGFAMRAWLRAPAAEPEPPLWLGFAIGGLLCLAWEIAVH